LKNKKRKYRDQEQEPKNLFYIRSLDPAIHFKVVLASAAGIYHIGMPLYTHLVVCASFINHFQQQQHQSTELQTKSVVCACAKVELEMRMKMKTKTKMEQQVGRDRRRVHLEKKTV